MCVFLAGKLSVKTRPQIFSCCDVGVSHMCSGSDLFREERVHEYLSALLHWYCAPRSVMSIDLSETIPGLASFSDLWVFKSCSVSLCTLTILFPSFSRYSSLLDQFVAVSYGDHLFASYLTLPLQQRHDSHFRKMFWNDYPTIFRIFSLPLTQVPTSLSEYLYPEEQDPVLLRLYMNTLGTGSVRLVWTAKQIPRCLSGLIVLKSTDSLLVLYCMQLFFFAL